MSVSLSLVKILQGKKGTYLVFNVIFVTQIDDDR